MTTKTQQIKVIREGLMIALNNISKHALHISLLTGRDKLLPALTALSDEQFTKISGIPKNIFMKVFNMQNDTWRSLIEGNFEIQVGYQIRKAAEIVFTKEN